MDMMQAIAARHSVRRYRQQAIEPEKRAAIEAEIHACNQKSGLHIQLVTDEPKAFDCLMAHYGKFSGVTNYIALVGRKSPDFEERCGYWGEHLALAAQQMGLNTCWVAMSYRKVPGAFRVDRGEKLALVISLGYGETQGAPHRSKTAEQVSNVGPQTPEWFAAGVEAALLAPTAMNQQRFTLTYKNGEVEAKAGAGFYTKVDLGIVKYHFEIGANRRFHSDEKGHIE